MRGVAASRVIVIATIAVAAIGAIDAVRGRSADLVAVFVLVGLLQVALLLRLQLGRRPITLRPDLAAWLDRRAELTGEGPDRIIDRLVAHHRSQIRGKKDDR